MTVQRLYRVIVLIRYALLGLAVFFIFVLDWNKTGLVLALAVLAVGIALRIAPVQRWLARQFTNHHRAAPVVPPTAAPATEMTQADIEVLLAAEARPAIFLRRHWPPQDPAPQNSWLGGLPRLPEGVDWPINPQSGLALHHLAQIDLTEMPRIDSETPLPAQGMLWFFADIDEELDWDVGPGMAQARVLYHDRSTAGQPLCAAPANLPEVDHSGKSMHSRAWSFRPARFAVYPRWPLTGHATTTWPLDSLPAGLSWDSDYAEARTARMNAELALVRGALPAAPEAGPGIYQPELTLAADGITQRKTGKTLYCPDAYGPLFPYHNAMGAEVLLAFHHKLRAKLTDAEGTLRWTPAEIEKQKQRGKDVEHLLARLQRAEQEATRCRDRMAQFTDLYDRLAAASATSALTDDHQRRFDALLRGILDEPELKFEGANAVGRGLQRIVQRSFDAPELLDPLPDAFVATLNRSFLLAADTTHHFLMGAKGMASNPTAGRGQRLAQFDSDYAVDFMFCDVGIIDFWIDPDDLAAGRWDRAWAATAGG